MSISNRLKEALKKDDRSLYAIGKLTGIDRAVLKRFVMGERSITLETADKLAAFYKLTLK